MLRTSPMSLRARVPKAMAEVVRDDVDAAALAGEPSAEPRVESGEGRRTRMSPMDRAPASAHHAQIQGFPPLWDHDVGVHGAARAVSFSLLSYYHCFYRPDLLASRDACPPMMYPGCVQICCRCGATRDVRACRRDQQSVSRSVVLGRAVRKKKDRGRI